MRHRLDQELEAQIAARPDDLELRRVYADWLIEAGNPRGELAALQLAGDEAAARAVIEEHHDQLVGKELRGYDITWCGGFWDALEVDEPYRSIPTHPSARLLRTLVLSIPGPYESYVEWVTRGRLPALRSFSMGGHHYDGQEIGEEADWSCANLHVVLERFPRLEELTITCGKFSFSDSASLRSFTCDGYSLRRESLQAIFDAKLPSLARLDLRDEAMIGEEDFAMIEIDDYTPLLSGELFPALREVRLRDCGSTLLARAKVSPLARRATITDR